MSDPLLPAILAQLQLVGEVLHRLAARLQEQEIRHAELFSEVRHLRQLQEREDARASAPSPLATELLALIRQAGQERWVRVFVGIALAGVPLLLVLWGLSAIVVSPGSALSAILDLGGAYMGVRHD